MERADTALSEFLILFSLLSHFPRTLLEETATLVEELLEEGL